MRVKGTFLPAKSTEKSSRQWPVERATSHHPIAPSPHQHTGSFPSPPPITPSLLRLITSSLQYITHHPITLPPNQPINPVSHHPITKSPHHSSPHQPTFPQLLAPPPQQPTIPTIPHWPLPAVRDFVRDGRLTTYDGSVLKLSKVSFQGKCARTGHPLKLLSPTKLARWVIFLHLARRAALPARCSILYLFSGHNTPTTHHPNHQPSYNPISPSPKHSLKKFNDDLCLGPSSYFLHEQKLLLCVWKVSQSGDDRGSGKKGWCLA
jgi:hypothetical protein